MCVSVGMVWRIIIDGLRSVASTTAYASPRIDSFIAGNLSTFGGDVVVVIGENFGPATPSYLQDVTYGPSGTEYTAQNCSVVVDHTHISCVTVPGVGANLRWVVTIAGQPSEPSAATTSYQRPSIDAWNLGGVSLLAVGGYSVRLGVSNVGYHQYLVQSYVDVLFNGGDDAVRRPVNTMTLTSNASSVGYTNVAEFTMPPGLGLVIGVQLVVVDGVTGVETPSNVVTANYSDPVVGKVVSSMRYDVDGLNCTVMDPVTGQAANPNNGLFAVSVFGFNFGDGDDSGSVPVPVPGVSVAVVATLQPVLGGNTTVTTNLSCFARWSDDNVQFLVPYPGTWRLLGVVWAVAVDSTACYCPEPSLSCIYFVSAVTVFAYHSPAALLYQGPSCWSSAPSASTASRACRRRRRPASTSTRRPSAG